MRSCKESFGFGARNDDQVLVAPRVERRLDFVNELFARNQADVETFVAGAFGRHLIFDVQRSDASLLELADTAHRVDGVAIAGFTIADDGNVDRVDDVARLVDHFRKRQQPGIGEAEGAVLSAAICTRGKPSHSTRRA